MSFLYLELTPNRIDIHPLDKLLGKGMFIVLKFIIEYNSLRDFGP
jgi:hypothetical protein